MPKIDFYILSETTEKAGLLFACRLIEKAYKQNFSIYIHTQQAASAYALDELLWTYRDDSFLPHNLLGEELNPPPPIQIGFASAPQKPRDILINLSEEVPVFYSQFSRVLELVINTPDEQQKGRLRYRVYREAQHAIQTHKLESIEV